MQVKPEFLTEEFEASGRLGFLMTRVLEGDGTVNAIRRLANLSLDDEIQVCVTENGRILLRLLKGLAREYDLPHVQELLQRYGHWYGGHLARGGCVGCRS